MKTEQIAPSFWQVTVNHEHTKLVFFSQHSRESAIMKAWAWLHAANKEQSCQTSRKKLQ